MSSLFESSAVFSEFRTHRYALFRQWRNGDRAMFIGLNPSTADETLNDPTVRRCMGFVKKLRPTPLVRITMRISEAPSP